MQSDISTADFKDEIEQRGGTVDFFGGCVHFGDMRINAAFGNLSNREQLAHVLREWQARKRLLAEWEE